MVRSTSCGCELDGAKALRPRKPPKIRFIRLLKRRFGYEKPPLRQVFPWELLIGRREVFVSVHQFREKLGF